MDTAALSALVSAAAAVLVVLVGKVFTRRTDKATAERTVAEAEKVEAEAGAIIQAGYEKYIVLLEERLNRLEARVTDLETALRAEQAQTRSLTRLLRSTIRWALTLRDEVIRLGGEVPATPADVELALTTLEPPE